MLLAFALYSYPLNDMLISETSVRGSAGGGGPQGGKIAAGLH